MKAAFLLFVGITLALAAARSLDPQAEPLRPEAQARKSKPSKFATLITPDPDYKPLM